MNRVLLLAFILTMTGEPSFSDDLTLPNGKTYTNYGIKRVEPDGVTITHSSGIVKLFFWELPSEIQKRFQYDPDKAREYSAQSQLQQSAIWARQQEAARLAQQKVKNEAERAEAAAGMQPQTNKDVSVRKDSPPSAGPATTAVDLRDVRRNPAKAYIIVSYPSTFAGVMKARLSRRSDYSTSSGQFAVSGFQYVVVFEQIFDSKVAIETDPGRFELWVGKPDDRRGRRPKRFEVPAGQEYVVAWSYE